MSSRTRRGLALAALAFAALAFAAAATEAEDEAFRFLHVLPTHTDPAWSPGDPTELILRTRRPADLAARLRTGSIVSADEEGIRVRIDPYAFPTEPPTEDALASTFLVDYETEAVRRLVASRAGGERPTPEALVAWVRDAVEPSNDRGFDPASVVARKGRGDCTEHAVLFSALARSHGYPTRIALGLVLAESEHGVHSYGHAWTELWNGRRWILVDPTDIVGGEVLGYLPTGWLADEGPGYGGAVVRSGLLWIHEVRVGRER